MNRRGFFRRTIGAIAAASTAPFWPKVAPSMTFKGIPLVFDDEVCGPPVYKIIGIYNMTTDNPRRLGVITSIA